MEIVAIANQKGGCGKTTTAINLAAALGRRGKRVLLVDMDPQGHASLGLGQRSEERPGLYEVFLREVTIGEVIVADAAPGVDLVPGTISLAAVEHLLADTAEREWRLASHLAQLEGAYDYTVIDCPPSLGLLSFNALRAADRVVVPVELSAFSLDGLERLSETIELLAERYKTDIPVTILPVMVDQRPRFTREMLRALRDAFAETVAQSSIHYTVRLKEAALAGLSIFAHEPKGMGSLDYDRLARELMGEQVGRVTVTAFSSKQGRKGAAGPAVKAAKAGRGIGKGKGGAAAKAAARRIAAAATADDDDDPSGLPAEEDTESPWDADDESDVAMQSAAGSISRWAETGAIGAFGGLEASAIGLDDDPTAEPLAKPRGRAGKAPAKAAARPAAKSLAKAVAKPVAKAVAKSGAGTVVTAAPKRSAPMAKKASARPTTNAVSKAAAKAAPAAGPKASAAPARAVRAKATAPASKGVAFARMSEVTQAARAAAGADPAPTLQEVVLSFDKLSGRRVQVAGDFNDWIPDRDVATRKGKGGVRKVLKLRPGAYQYRVIVDGIWREDPGNPERVPNIYGGENSLLHVEVGSRAPSR
jgi:cellulose biosynthesis protein BcsQ